LIASTSSDELFAGETDDPHLLAARAYVWGFPLVLAARLRQQFTSPEDPFALRVPTSAGAALNNIGHQRRLADPTLAGVAPNVDTLYSLAWLDLGSEPFVLETPGFGSRYYTFQIGHADTSADVSLGARTHGGSLPAVFIRGPDGHARARPGMVEVTSHTRYAIVAGRILVQPDDPADFEAVYELQRAVRLRPLSRWLSGEPEPNPVRAQRPLDDGVEGVDPDLVALVHVGNVLRDWLVSPREQSLLHSFRAIGLTREHGFRAGEMPRSATAAVARGLADGAALVEERSRNLGRNVNGWTVNDRGPRFGDDYLLRAAVAKEQIYVTVPEEALYPVAAVDGAGAPLTGENVYTIAFAAGALPPADAFWSLTMYALEGPPLVPNPIDRYAIGDRTPGLVTRADGSLTIQIQHARPPEETVVNWLPAPLGAFRLMLRLYVPRAGAVDGSWAPPPIERVPRL
jgi:hypothetical protein